MLACSQRGHLTSTQDFPLQVDELIFEAQAPVLLQRLQVSQSLIAWSSRDDLCGPVGMLIKQADL